MKHAWQSSNYSERFNRTIGALASFAVDNNLDTMAHTRESPVKGQTARAWWSVDLGLRSYDIDKIIVHNRDGPKGW